MKIEHRSLGIESFTSNVNAHLESLESFKLWSAEITERLQADAERVRYHIADLQTAHDNLADLVGATSRSGSGPRR